MDTMTSPTPPNPQLLQRASRGWQISFWFANGAVTLGAVSILSILTFGLKAFRREPVSFQGVLFSLGILAVVLVIQYLIARPVYDALQRNSTSAKTTVAIGAIVFGGAALLALFIAMGEIFVLGQ